VHDDMLTLLDACIDRMLLTRERLAAARRVHPGERHATVLAAIAAAEHFATEATRTLTAPSPLQGPAGLTSGAVFLPHAGTRPNTTPAPHAARRPAPGSAAA